VVSLWGWKQQTSKRVSGKDTLSAKTETSGFKCWQPW
jgi:hypothetical protein